MTDLEKLITNSSCEDFIKAYKHMYFIETTDLEKELSKYDNKDIIMTIFSLKRYDILKEIGNDETINHLNGFETQIIEDMGYVPIFYINRVDLFKYYFNQKRYDIAISFNERQKEIKEILYNNIELFLQVADRLINECLKNPSENKYNFRHSNIFFSYCITNKIFDAIQYFYIYTISNDIINKYLDQIYDYFLSQGKITKNFIYLSELFNKFLENKKYNMCLQFSDYLFTDEIKDYISSNKDILLSILENNRYDTLKFFNENLFTPNIINTYGNILLDNFYSLPDCLKNNQQFFILCLENNKFDLVKFFNENLFTPNIINKYGNILLDNFYSLPDCLKNNQQFFILCLENNKFDLVKFFNEDLFTTDIINTYGNKFLDNFYSLPNCLKNNQQFFILCLENNKFNLINSFNEDLFTTDIINKYGNILLDNFYSLPNCLKNNQQFFILCLENNKFNLINSFNEDLFTTDIINTYGNILLDNFYSLPINLKNNSQLFQMCIDKEKFDLLIQFSESLFTNDIINTYGSKIINMISFIPNNLKNNSQLFQICIDNKKFDLLIEFSENLFTTDIINTYGSKIINMISFIPNNLKNNSQLFQICIDNKKFDLLIEFSDIFFTPDIINKYGSIIVNTITSIPYYLKDNRQLFQVCIDNEKFNLLIQFNDELIEQNASELIKIFKKNNTVPDEFKNSKSLKKYCLENNEIKLFIQFHLDISTIESQDEMDEYAKILRLNPEIFKYKIQYLYSKNDEIFNTLDIRLLSSRMDIFSLEDIERISIYTDIQNLILNKDDNFLKILAKIFQIIDKDSYDISPLIYKILTNSDSDKYQSLFKSIKIDNLSNEILENLIYILQNDNNYYEITNIEDLTDENFNIIRERKKYKEEDFENKKLSLEQIKELLLQEKFNMTMEMANFICMRYCTDIEALNKSQISLDTKRILQSIYIICTSTSYEELKYFYLNTKSTVNEYDAAYLLEAKIRSEFAKLYSDSLYKIKDEHKMQKDKNVNDNVYNALNEIEYKGKKVNFYIMDGDFNMQIHILGAYRYWTNPENYKEDWERPKIAYHGICTSYIGNNQIANARQSHPCYGFDSYEESALLLAGPYDLLSDSSISKYATSINEPYNLYTPEVMINKTRHTHNEMVIERRAKSKIQSFKRLPSYVVYFVDDINNIPNQINDSLFQESIQAAVDNDIPIIIVDRLKYAKSEKKKIDDRINQFKANPNINDLNYIITNYCNNMIGCAYYDTQERCEYHDVFSKEDLENIVKYLYNIIIELPTEDKNKLLVAMNNLINTEQINFQIPNTILNENYNSLFTEIFLIYQNLDDTTKGKIEKDIKNGVQLQTIKNKIENNEYEVTTSMKK